MKNQNHVQSRPTHISKAQPNFYYQQQSSQDSFTIDNPLNWWSENWNYMNSLSYRKIFLYSYLIAIPLLIFSYIFLRPSSSEILRILFKFLFSPISAIILSAILALPGLIFRGIFEVKPLFLSFTLMIYCEFLSESIILPLGYKLNFPLLFSILGLLINTFAVLVFLPTLFLTWMTHSWENALQKLGIGITGIILLLMSFTSLKKSNQKIFLEENVSLARAMAGKEISTHELISEIKER